MKGLFLLNLAVILLNVLEPNHAMSVCHDDLGCFDDHFPFINTLGVVPESPESIGTRFFLYTSLNGRAERLHYSSPSGVNSSSFDPTVGTKFIIHGFRNSLQNRWIGQMKYAFLKTGRYNVITVGWGRGAYSIAYNQVVSNSRLVARQIAKLIQVLQQTKGLDLNSVHMIGFSVGAHLAGYVSRELGFKVGRITGLDPAGLLFQSFGTDVYLDTSDANFVDIIHSNGRIGGAGTFISHGHVDFYPNGGARQPGCEKLGCSHSRSHEMFIASIYASCTITSFPCQSQTSYANGQCLSCGYVGCNTPGLYVRTDTGLGDQFYATTDMVPFCGQNYLVTIQLRLPLLPTNINGKLKVALRGDKGYTDWALVHAGTLPANGDGVSRRYIAFKEDVGQVREILLSFTPDLMSGKSAVRTGLSAMLASTVLGAVSGGSLTSGLGLTLPMAAAASGGATLDVIKVWVQTVPNGYTISSVNSGKLTARQSTSFHLQ